MRGKKEKEIKKPISGTSDVNGMRVEGEESTYSGMDHC